MTHEPDKPLRCSECKQEPREDENPDDEWRVESDGVGGMRVFCPECWSGSLGKSTAAALLCERRARPTRMQPAGVYARHP